MIETDVVVIGGGPGGYAAAFAAADHGMQVTLVNLDKNPGGVCLYKGCIPSKALLHIAKLVNETEEASHWGLEYQKPVIHLDKMRAWKDSVIAKMTGGLGVLTKQRKVNYVQGYASFADSYTLNIKKSDGTEDQLKFNKAIIAIGSIITTIPSLMINSPRLLNSTTALELPEIPGSMLVIGGGYIGLELGSVYSALGTKVSVVEMTSGLLPGADRDLVQHLQKRVEAKFDKIMLSTKVQKLEDVGNGIKVAMQDKDGKDFDVTYDYVLMSIGRRPSVEGLGLENTKVTTTPRGHIVVDPQRRTLDDHIYAIGDIAGDPMLAHKANHEAHIAVAAIAGSKAIYEPRAIPAVVFTDPEIAWAGITETEAQAQGVEYEVGKFPWAASGRATTLGRNDGLTKVIVDPKTERILGIGICGPGAGELIAEGALAIEMGATVTDLKLTIHPHPTLSETVMEAAEMFFGASTHMYKPKRK